MYSSFDKGVLRQSDTLRTTPKMNNDLFLCSVILISAIVVAQYTDTIIEFANFEDPNIFGEKDIGYFWGK